jgi:multidrug efflux pump subunit AcrA (membrane-fusion protein)
MSTLWYRPLNGPPDCKNLKKKLYAAIQSSSEQTVALRTATRDIALMERQQKKDYTRERTTELDRARKAARKAAAALERAENDIQVYSKLLEMYCKDTPTP